MFYTIYKITNKINGKFYIGMHKTNNLEDGYMGSGKLIKRAIEKHGVDNFKKEILHIFNDEDKMIAKEKELVVLSEQSYNLCDGGKGGFGYINHSGKNLYGMNGKTPNTQDNLKRGRQTQERNKIEIPGYADNIRKKISESQKGKPGTFLGKKHSIDTIDKLKNHKRQDGEKNSQYGTCWITDGQKNKKIRKEELEEYVKLGYYKGRKNMPG